VVLTRPFRMHRLSGLSYSALALLVGALVWRFADLAGTYGAERLRGGVLSLLLALAGLAVVVNLLIVAFALRNSIRWRVHVDWARSRIVMRDGSGTREVAFPELNELELRGVLVEGRGFAHSSSRGAGSRRRPDRYRFEVVLHAGGRRHPRQVLALATDNMPFMATKDAYRCLLSLTADLGTALNVPHRYTSFRPPSDYPPVER
jgi:hypothetical protein